jgi:hypothetical protein
MIVASAALAVGCGGGGDETTSAASLQSLLLPAAQLKPLVLRQKFAWDNPTDYVAQGVSLPETSPPSKTIAAVEDAGFNSAAGQDLTPKSPGVQVHVLVANFDSSDGARQALDELHAQDLQQPCAAACTVDPRPFKLTGIPNSEAIHQVPNGNKPPPGSRPFERFVVEFTIGSDLYTVDASGGPGDIPAARFSQGADTVYKYAFKHSS